MLRGASPDTNLATHDRYTGPGATGNSVQGSDKSSGSTNSNGMSIQTSRGTCSHGSGESSTREGLGDTVNGSSSIGSNKSAYLATDESFSTAGGDASAEDSNKN